MALLQQLADRLSPLQLERGSRHRRAVGGAQLPNDGLDPRDKGRVDTQFIDTESDQQRDGPEI
jgi:hypothetical protein